MIVAHPTFFDRVGTTNYRHKKTRSSLPGLWFLFFAWSTDQMNWLYPPRPHRGERGEKVSGATGRCTHAADRDHFPAIELLTPDSRPTWIQTNMYLSGRCIQIWFYMDPDRYDQIIYPRRRDRLIHNNIYHLFSLLDHEEAAVCDPSASSLLLCSALQLLLETWRINQIPSTIWSHCDHKCMSAVDNSFTRPMPGQHFY